MSGILQLPAIWFSYALKRHYRDAEAILAGYGWTKADVDALVPGPAGLPTWSDWVETKEVYSWKSSSRRT